MYQAPSPMQSRSLKWPELWAVIRTGFLRAALILPLAVVVLWAFLGDDDRSLGVDGFYLIIYNLKKPMPLEEARYLWFGWFLLAWTVMSLLAFYRRFRRQRGENEDASRAR